MVTAINDDLFAPEVIANPYPYFEQLREEDPVHWNEKYGVWILTRYDDVVWVTRHHEQFSSETFKRDPRPPYPEIDEEDQPIYEFIKAFQIDRFIQHDRPAHFDMRMVLSRYFTPKAMESWRPMVRNAIKYLIDGVEDYGRMDVMRDFAIPSAPAGNRPDDGSSQRGPATHPPVGREAVVSQPGRAGPDAHLL